MQCALLSSSLFAQQAILFQIPSSSSQIKYAESQGDQKSVAHYKRSDNQIKKAIFKNFKGYFNFCPVYFFKSANYDDVKKGDLKSVQFYNDKGEEVSVPAGLKDYQVANISFFPKVLNKVVKDGVEVFEEAPEDHFGIGIIINNIKFVPIMGKMRFTPCKIFKRGSIFNRKKRYYEFRGAESLNRKLFKHSIQVKSTQ